MSYFLSFDSYAQQSKVAAGDKKYDNYAYIDAIKTYERVAEKGYKSEDMFKKLGNSYYFNSEFYWPYQFVLLILAIVRIGNNIQAPDLYS